MKIFNPTILKYILCSVAVSLLLSTPAYAYIDPGTISIVVQGAIAGVAGAAATFKYWVHWVKGLFLKTSLKEQMEEIEEIEEIDHE